MTADIKIESLTQAQLDAIEAVNHPAHYNNHPAGIECIDVVEHLCFNIGNAIKYLWRCDHKGNAIEQLEKAKWYIQREIELRKRGKNGTRPQNTVIR